MSGLRHGQCFIRCLRTVKKWERILPGTWQRHFEGIFELEKNNFAWWCLQGYCCSSIVPWNKVFNIQKSGMRRRGWFKDIQITRMGPNVSREGARLIWGSAATCMAKPWNLPRIYIISSDPKVDITEMGRLLQPCSEGNTHRNPCEHLEWKGLFINNNHLSMVILIHRQKVNLNMRHVVRIFVLRYVMESSKND